MQQNFNQAFSGFPETSRVWIYGSNREISISEQQYILENLKEFTGQWATHGKELIATAEVFLSNFVVFVVDESRVKASGCSIDSSVRFIKVIGSALKIDFFNRLSMLIENDGNLERIHYNDLNSKPNSFVFDTTIQNLGEFRTGFMKKIADSKLVSTH